MYRLAGGVLLVLAVVILFAAPDSPGLEFLGMLGFITCLVSGFFLVSGIVGTPRDIGPRRQEVAQRGARGDWQPVQIPPRVFRYQVSVPGRVVILIMAFFLIAIGIGIFCLFGVSLLKGRVVDMQWWEAIAWTIAASVIPAGAGVLLLLYLHRYRGISIRVDEWGIRAQTLLGHVEIPWQEVVALKQVNPDVPTIVGLVPLVLPLGAIYRVYSLHKTLEFYYSLEGAADLVALIQQATGLSWD